MKLISAVVATFFLLVGHAFAIEPVDINRANVAELSQGLKGIGQTKAAAIVAYREQHGAFQSLEQLAEVSGIGLKLVALNRDRMFLTPELPPSQ